MRELIGLWYASLWAFAGAGVFFVGTVVYAITWKLRNR